MNDLFAISVAKAADLTSNSGLNSPDANVAASAFLNRVADLLLVLAIPLAVLSVVYAAFTLIRSQGKPDGYANAKKYLIYVVTGIFLIVFAGIIVRTIYNLFGEL